MTMKTTPKGIRRPQFLKAASLALLFLQGNQLLAQVNSATKPPQAQEGISVLEILGYVAMIVGVILLAWIIGAAQSKKSPTETHVRPTHHRHFDHPNDPHFRKLKKKTS
jgi:hypothetical protein